MLVDDVTVLIKAGNGGNGSVSLKRNAQTAKGGPDGGNGGKGGDVYIVGVNDIDALVIFKYKKEIRAEDGINGGRQQLYGRNGIDLVIKVTLGTVVKDLSNNTEFEVTDVNSKVLLARGGRGGRGNMEFKSATNQTPKYAETGERGEVKKIHFELKLIADIGLIGLPNAGKSSLLSVLTRANPKIGDYPFTTLEPNLGVMPARNASYSSASVAGGEGLVIADIPGLIEGASNGKGLGDKFLKHVERTKVLVHCVDTTSKNPLEVYKTVREELRNFNPVLLEKKEIIVLTKTDNSEPKIIDVLTKKFKKISENVLPISIYDDNSLEILKIALKSSLN